MEHRRSSRTPLRHDVGLDSPRSGPLTACSRNFSLGGLFIEMESPDLLPGTAVKVSFVLPRNGTRAAFALDAEVVRHGPDGIGLMFLRMDPGVIRSLSRALAEGRVPTVS